MKNFKLFFNSKLVVAFVLLSANFGFAQPVIRVPATCNVVVAGSGVGAVTGFGGQVGNGGVVAMPDPYSAAVFTYIPNSTTVTGWKLLGDLSMGTSTLPLYNNPIVSDGAVTQVKIQSYNKTYRSSELYPDPTWARSKGKVTVSYSATCGGSISFEVFKVYVPNAVLPTQPTNIPKIVGPTCLLPNTQYTYSVDQIASDNAGDAIGFDSYYWSGIPASYLIPTNLYNSADTSSITFTTSATVTGFTLKCCYGRANNTFDGGNSSVLSTATGIHTTCVSLALVPSPVAPVFSATTLSSTTTTLNNSLTGCLQTGQTSFSVTYPNPPVTTPATTYTWSVGNTGWSYNNNTTGTTTTTFSGIDNNPGQIKLTVNNGSCNPVDFVYQINRTFVSTGTTPLAISPANTCVSAGSTTTFSINGLGNGTTWSLSPSIAGATITPTTVGSSMSLFLPTTATGTYTLTATGNTTGAYLTCGGSITTSIYIKPAAPTTPSGATCVVRNGGPSQTYTCSTVTGATGYLWSFPAGWSATAVTTTSPTVTITPNGTSNSGSISVIALGVAGSNCNSASSPSLAINYSVDIPAIAEKPNCYNVNMSSLVTVNVTNAPSPFFGAYTVTLTPAGASTTPASTPNYAVASSVVFNGSASPNTISFNTTDTLANIIAGTPTIVSPPPGTYDLWITFDTQSTGGTCTATASIKIQIVIPPANAASLFTSYNPALNGADNYIVTGAPSGATYVWRVAGNILSGANSSSILLAGNGTFPGRVSVDVIPQPATLGACSSITRLISPTGASHSLRQAPPVKVTKNLDGVVVYPNPNSGNFTIELENVKQAASGILTDMNGKQLAIYLLQKGENTFQNEGLAKGTYILSINIDGVTQAKKIVIK